jgi:hypothetical protein
MKKNKSGNKYTKDLDELGGDLALLGLTTLEMASIFRVDPRTISTWMRNHPSFAEAVRAGRIIADAKVARKLFGRATGVTVKKQKVLNSGDIVDYYEELPPDTKAAQVWLACRTSVANGGRGQWTEKTQVELSGDAENPLAFIMGEVSKEAETAGPLPSQQANFRADD